MKFSDRIGVTAPKTLLQINSIDDELTLKLWNVIYSRFLITKYLSLDSVTGYKDIFFHDLWGTFLKRKLNEYPKYIYQLVDFLEVSFFKGHWYERYNLLEFILGLKYINNILSIEEFSEKINNVLKEELSGYRLSNGLFIPITSEDELDSIETALNVSDKFSGAKIHLRTSIELLADKKTPDYRNSIKESISAVETIASIIAEKPKATLGEALRIIEKKYPLHRALKEGFEKLYGYTSDADGIRHKILDENINLEQADAVYMLISCSSFINYLISKFANLEKT